MPTPDSSKSATNTVDFTNTEIAFRRLSNPDLMRAYTLFKVLAHQTLVQIGTKAVTLGMKLHLPVGLLVEKTLYKHFCGGNSIENCQSVIDSLASEKVSTILDFSTEGKDTEASIDETCEEIIRTIAKAKKSHDIVSMLLINY